MNASRHDELPVFSTHQPVQTLRRGKEAQRGGDSQGLIFLCGPRRSPRLSVNLAVTFHACYRVFMCANYTYQKTRPNCGCAKRFKCLVPCLAPASAPPTPARSSSPSSKASPAPNCAGVGRCPGGKTAHQCHERVNHPVGPIPPLPQPVLPAADGQFLRNRHPVLSAGRTGVLLCRSVARGGRRQEIHHAHHRAG